MSKITIEIYPYSYIALTLWVSDTVLELAALTPQLQGLMPDYYWTVATHHPKFTQAQYQKWKARSGKKTYKLSVDIDLALAYIYNIDNFKNFFFGHQEIKDALIHCLINRGFSMDRFKIPEYELIA